MKKNILQFKILFFAFLFFALSFAVFAQNVLASAFTDCIAGGSTATECSSLEGAGGGLQYVAPLPQEISYSSPSAYIASLYKWGIGIVGILALVQLIRGGILYMVSGAVDQKGAAKEHILNALIGLGLALASYIILTIINPTLLELKEPGLKKSFKSSSMQLSTGEALDYGVEITGNVLTVTYDATAEGYNTQEKCETVGQQQYGTRYISATFGNNKCIIKAKTLNNAQ